MTVDPEMTVGLTVREARALRNMGELLAGAFEDEGCDLTGVEREDGTWGPAPLVSACMKLELALTLEGAEL